MECGEDRRHGFALEARSWATEIGTGSAGMKGGDSRRTPWRGDHAQKNKEGQGGNHVSA